MAVSATIAAIATGVTIAKTAQTVYHFFSNPKEVHDNASSGLLKSATKPELKIDLKSAQSTESSQATTHRRASPAA